MLKRIYGLQGYVVIIVPHAVRVAIVQQFHKWQTVLSKATAYNNYYDSSCELFQVKSVNIKFLILAYMYIYVPYI